jgi:hypothetical protein
VKSSADHASEPGPDRAGAHATKRDPTGPSVSTDPGFRGRGLLGLQRSAGNRAVSRMLGRSAVQRVPVDVPTREETLFNDHTSLPGAAKPATFGSASTATFDMTRDGTPEVVTCTVKIRFVSQRRDAKGEPVGPITVIPVGDPRRAFAQNIVDTSPAVWNGRAKLVGKHIPSTAVGAAPAPVDPAPITLPLVFKSQAVWDLTSPYDSTVNVFAPSVVAGSKGNPIDSGDYYMNRGAYAGMSELQIYAHEYGHLIGLPDEYSQSNPEMNALLHGIDPATAATRKTAMDRAAVQHSVMAALTRPLIDRLTRARGEIVNAFQRGSAPVRTALGGELTAALGNSGVQGLFELGLPPTSAALAPTLPALVAAAASASRNTTGLASKVVASEFAPAALGGLVHDIYWRELYDTQGAVDVGGITINIDVEGRSGIGAGGNANIPPNGLYAFASAGPAKGHAAKVATSVVGAAQTGRTPPIRPSAALISQLDALPAAWTAFSAAAPAELSAAVLGNDMGTALTTAWLARMMGAAATPATVMSATVLAKKVDQSIHQAGLVAATNALRRFLGDQIWPIMIASMTALSTAVDTEVDAVMATPVGATAAAAPADPDIAYLATALHKKLDAQAKKADAAQTRAGTTPLDPGTTAPAQSVTYGTQNMMSDNTNVFRVDQFTELADRFNGPARLRKPDEDFFNAEVVAAAP